MERRGETPRPASPVHIQIGDVSSIPDEQFALDRLACVNSTWLEVDISSKRIREIFRWSCIPFVRDEDFLDDLREMSQWFSELREALFHPVRNCPTGPRLLAPVHRQMVFTARLNESLRAKIDYLKDFVDDAVQLQDEQAGIRTSTQVTESGIAEGMRIALADRFQSYRSRIQAHELGYPNLIRTELRPSDKRKREYIFEHFLEMLLDIEAGLQKFWLAFERLLRDLLVEPEPEPNDFVYSDSGSAHSSESE